MRRTIKSIFNFYINSSIHVSLAIVCLAAITFLNFHLPVKVSLLIFIFLGSVTSYNFVKYGEIVKLHHRSLAKNLKLIQLFSIVVFIALVVTTFYQPYPVLILAFSMGVITALYALPVFSNQRNLRELPGVKIFVIAFVVAGVTVIMPLLLESDIPHRDIIIEFLQRFVIVVVLIIPFEIRDLKYDKSHLETLPQRYGVRKTKVIGYILLSIFILSEVLKQKTNLVSVLSLLFVGFVVFLFLKKSSVNQGKYYSSFWVEAIPFFWLIILVTLSRII